MGAQQIRLLLVTKTFLYLFYVGLCVTDPNDFAILDQFRKGLENAELLKWPGTGNDPCGPPSWPHVYCSGNRVSQIQVQNMNLKGPLPQNFNQLSMLSNLGMQRNQFSGPLPSFSGLSNLRWAYLDYNNFDTIPADFFHGLDSLEVLALDGNPLNKTDGWSLPNDLQNSALLQNLTMVSCNLAGPLPDFLGQMSSLGVLLLSFNRISGGIPATFGGSGLKMLWLNGQTGGGMSGTIDVVASMTSLTSLWLHGNQFSGKLPVNMGDLTSLQDLNLNGNNFVGLIPDSFSSLSLITLDLNNNHFMGPVPNVKAKNFSYGANAFCQPDPGTPCAPEVMSLLRFIDQLNYPPRLVSSWSGNDPCGGDWLGVNCNANQKVSSVRLPKFNLSGTLASSLSGLDSVTQIVLSSNGLTGQIPANWATLKSLTLLDLSSNNLSPPLPKFSSSVKLVLNGNPLLSSPSPAPQNTPPAISPPSLPPAKNTPPVVSPGSPPKTTPVVSPSSPPKTSPVVSPGSPSNIPPSQTTPSGTGTGGTPSNGTSRGNTEASHSKNSKKNSVVVIVASAASCAFLALLVVPLSIYLCKRREGLSQAPSSLVIHPRDPSDSSDNTVKIVVANNNSNGSASTASGSRMSSGMGESHVIEAGNLVISVQVLRNVTKNFAPENELGRGGFGTVYKGQLDDGTTIAVKRMESGVINNKALDEFQAEIAVLSKVRHRHLVSLLGYSTEGSERLLVYEYMPQGALSKHLFHWKSSKLEPLSWKRRLYIALDVARGMEYLHTLAHQSFIHRDLKSSNILLGDDFRAKVSDFGLVKLAPDGVKSVVTRLAGTFGYLAPEYAVTGKITTKADVFSFGVVLMELITGLMALDEDRPEESQYLAAWFWNIKSNKEKLLAAVDPSLDVNEEMVETICIIAELAGHCTAREPTQRPDMGHAVSVLAPLVEKWKPMDDDTDDFCGIDYSLPLTQMVKGWQESEGKGSFVDLSDSKSSIPARPAGFAESFTSADGR